MAATLTLARCVHVGSWHQHACCAGPGEAEQEGVNAVCDVLSAVLRVEHRAVQPHLADIWRLLWQAAAGQQSCSCIVLHPIGTGSHCLMEDLLGNG